MPLNRQFILEAVIYFSLAGVILSCSPGPRFGYRHPLRPLSPLLRGQFIPSISEKTIGASGPSEGRITRDSPKFPGLLHNYNPNIIFSDEEGDGTDRIMTQRCKDRVDTLAILVANQWPGVRLRIIEAWDPDLTHGPDSLRYEGRAVDFTTSDRDLSKYGMLARLAVEAGFDWVYYLSRFRVYASVRSDNSDAAKLGGCFPAGSLVISENNRTIRMSDVAVGDKLLAIDRVTGQLVYSDVILMMDRQIDADGKFITISTAENEVTLTPNHQLFAINGHLGNKTLPTYSLEKEMTAWLRHAEPIYAEEISAGQYIFIKSETGQASYSVPIKVLSTRVVVRRGLIAPLTRHGTILVDGAAASCYSVFKYEPLAHAAFFPVRTFDFFQAEDKTFSGIHWYARTLISVAESIFPETFFRLI